MKTLLYFTTIIFNIIGALVSISLFFMAGIDFLPVICIGLGSFITALTVTILDFNRTKNTKLIFLKKNPSEISDYRQYFVKMKNDFIII